MYLLINMDEFARLMELREKIKKSRGAYRKKYTAKFDDILKNVLQSQEEQRLEWENRRQGMVQSYEALSDKYFALQQQYTALKAQLTDSAGVNQ